MSDNLQKKKIREIWGNTTVSREIEKVFRKYNLDLFKLIGCCEKKGQDIRIATGHILAMPTMFDVIIQCECGEVMGFKSGIYKELAKLYSGGKIKCKRCDPNHHEKVMKVLKQLGRGTAGAYIKLPKRPEDLGL